ncbi:MAG: beta-galactosidase, partial [Planctomycetes bacterium]|nr:beta-galactosidase [Planctomycetota bacterium]
SARLRLTCRLVAPGDRQAELRLRFIPANFEGPSLETDRPVSLTMGTQEIAVVQRVEEPALWWPWDQGDQPLYSAEVTLVVDGQVVDVARERFGIRQIEINDDWEFRINGRRFFPRGTNIIPTQWLSEYDAEMIGADVKLLRGANVNFIRVHAHVNRDELYTACDEAGILVWQDFALQWSYEESDDLYQRAAGQLSDMIDWLYNHPSIVVWCCHNEPSVNRHTLDPLLAQVAREADSTRHVDIASDFHYHPYPGWYVGHYTEFCQLPRAPFVSEFGAQALPDVETLRQMFTPGELWPPDWDKWAWRDFQYDQTFNVAGVEMGESIEEFVANSQAYQSRLLQYAIEHYRAAKYAPITGLFQFMFVECWPSITWAVVDYYRQPKEGYYALQAAMQPILPSIAASRPARLERNRWVYAQAADFQAALWVVNDTLDEYPEAQLRWCIEEDGGEPVRDGVASVNIPSDGVRWAAALGDLDLAPGAYHLRVELLDAQGRELGRNEFTFAIEPPAEE